MLITDFPYKDPLHHRDWSSIRFLSCKDHDKQTINIIAIHAD